jgi:hypothetical protein
LFCYLRNILLKTSDEPDNCVHNSFDEIID